MNYPDSITITLQCKILEYICTYYLYFYFKLLLGENEFGIDILFLLSTLLL